MVFSCWIRKTLDSVVGPSRIELETSSLSEMHSNQLSYSPLLGLSFYGATCRLIRGRLLLLKPLRVRHRQVR